MPKVISNEQRALTKDAIYHSTIRLIREKGLRAVTVEDIVTAVGIGKASFYTYYESKEAWLFDVIKRCERELFAKMEEVMASAKSGRKKMVRILQEIYTAKDSMMSYVSQNDVEMLLRKLPAKYHEMERQKADGNFQTALALLKLDHHQTEVVALINDCLSFAASNRNYSRPGINEALRVMIDAMAGYVVTEKKKGR